MEHPKPSDQGATSPRTRLLAWLLIPLIVAPIAWYLISPREIKAFTVEDQSKLADQAAKWVRAEREARRPKALPLTPSELEAYGPFFPQQVLEDARVLGVEKMPNPRFAKSIRHQGRNVFNFSRARGLALDDTILLRGESAREGSSSRRSVLFHELVHVVQFEALGVDSFLEHYVDSLISNGYSYRAIVFEDQAFTLQSRFMAAPDEPFSVAFEVERLVSRLN